MNDFDLGGDSELEAALRDADVEPIAAALRLLNDIRVELVQPVADGVADAHIAAMRSVATPQPNPPEAVPANAAPRPRRHLQMQSWSRRVAAFVTCLGVGLGYGGLASAGALPGVHDVATHVEGWLGVRGATTPPRHSGPSFVPGSVDTGPPPSVPAPSRRASLPGPMTTPRYEGRPPTATPDNGGAPGAPGTGVTTGPTPPSGTPALSPGNGPSTNPAAAAANHGNSSTAPGRTTRGQSTNAPGHTTTTTPAQGNRTNAPGHTTAHGNATDNATSNGAQHAG